MFLFLFSLLSETVCLQDPRLHQALHGPQLSQETRQNRSRTRGPRHQKAAQRSATTAAGAPGERRKWDEWSGNAPEGRQSVWPQLPQRRGGLPACQIHQDGKLCGKKTQFGELRCRFSWNYFTNLISEGLKHAQNNQFQNGLFISACLSLFLSFLTFLLDRTC